MKEHHLLEVSGSPSLPSRTRSPIGPCKRIRLGKAKIRRFHRLAHKQLGAEQELVRLVSYCDSQLEAAIKRYSSADISARSGLPPGRLDGGQQALHHLSP